MLCSCFFVVFFIGHRLVFFFFFFNDTATTEIYTLSLHDALPIWPSPRPRARRCARPRTAPTSDSSSCRPVSRSEEHTSELQSQSNLVCRLLLEKKKKKKILNVQHHTIHFNHNLTVVYTIHITLAH